MALPICRDINRIEHILFEYFLIVGGLEGGLSIGARLENELLCIVYSVLVEVGERNELKLVKMDEVVADHSRTAVAKADNTKSYLFHFFSIPPPYGD